jgi:predicted glycoside hydrolase/deacetylase ChbG (UPF0249 family)
MFADKSQWGRLAQLFMLNTFCVSASKRGVLTPDNFSGFFYGGRLHIDHLKQVIKTLPNQGSCELMCHPGCMDNSQTYQHWHYDWENELAALTDSDVKRHLDARQVRLISYRDLARSI